MPRKLYHSACHSRKKVIEFQIVSFHWRHILRKEGASNMKRTIKKLLTLFCAWMMAGALSVSACAATIDGTAKLTITPTEPKVSGDTATVTYELTVTPPEGKELGVFSIQLGTCWRLCTVLVIFRDLRDDRYIFTYLSL